MLAEKKKLGVEELETQVAFELPSRELLAAQRGLVNVHFDDVTVQLPVGIAANVCDVNAAVLAAAIADTGEAECEAEVEQEL